MLAWNVPVQCTCPALRHPSQTAYASWSQSSGVFLPGELLGRGGDLKVQKEMSCYEYGMSLLSILCSTSCVPASAAGELGGVLSAPF